MSLRHLPAIKAFDGLSALNWEPDPDALARWNPALQSAAATDAEISIYDVIGDDGMGGGFTAKRASAALRAIGSRDVTVSINSPGGSFFEGLAVYNLLREHPHRVSVKVMGLAASAASVIAMAGDEVLMADASFLMVHNAWGIVLGNRHDLRQAADLLEPFDATMANLYASRAEVTDATAAAWMDDETWFSAAQAIEAGLADELLAGTEVTEAAEASTRSLAAIRRVESALAAQGLSRRERRSLLGEITARPAVADDHPELVAALRGLLSVMENKA